MVPMSYLVGYVPTKKFKKDVRDYCQAQYEMMVSNDNNAKKINKQRPQSKLHLPTSVALGCLKRVKKMEKTKSKKKDYYKEDVITFYNSSDDDDDDESDDDNERIKTLNSCDLKQKEQADIIASFRVYKMRGTNRVDVNTNKVEKPVKIQNDRPQNDMMKLGIGKLSNLVHL